MTGKFNYFCLERKAKRKKKRLEKKQKRHQHNQRFKQNITPQDEPKILKKGNINKTSKPKPEKKCKEVNEKLEKNNSLTQVTDSDTEEETHLTQKEVRDLQRKEAIEDEDKEIKRLEKLLKLNKRKRKSNKLPQGFKDMGLDYILDFIDGPKDDLYNDKDATKELLGIFSKNKSKENDNSSEEEDINDQDEADSENEESDYENEPTKKMLSKEGSKTSNKDKVGLKRKADTTKMLPNKKMKSCEENLESEDESMEDEEEIDNESEEDVSQDDEEANEESEEMNDEENLEEADEESQDLYDDDEKEVKEVDEASQEMDDESQEGEAEELDESEEGTSDIDNNDIYGQKNAKNLEQVQKSKLSEIDSEELELAQKSLNHCLRFVSDSEFQVISKLVQELYQEHSRNVMNKSLMANVEQVLLTKFMQDEDLLIKYAQIIAFLHANIGTEVGAHVLQNTALRFEAAYKAEETSHCMNIVTFLSYLFVFGVTDSLLLFDLLALLGQALSELDIKLILAVLKSVGFHLRKSNVQATEGLVATLGQTVKSKFPTQQDGSKEKLLLDILHAVKTRSLYKKLTSDPSEVDRHKKQIKLQLPRGVEVQGLNISYQDLLNAEGKVGWWIVGGGWEDANAQADNDTNPLSNVQLPKFDMKLEQLAESFNMNTELRKTLFCILMSYNVNEVFGRIQGLKLKSPHERDVVVVIVNTCLHYSKFKPMFGNLLQMLCKHDRHKYFMAIKCCLWDRMKELEDLTDSQLAIFSKLLTQLLTDSVVPISFLKPEYFTTPSRNAIRFIKTLLPEILMTDSDYNCKHIFSKIAKLPKFSFLCESIKAYLENHATTTRPRMKPADQAKFDKRLKMIMDTLNPELL